jgi:hypothetical protein
VAAPAAAVKIHADPPPSNDLKKFEAFAEQIDGFSKCHFQQRDAT